MPLATLFILAETLNPSVLLLAWGGGCVAVVAIGAAGLQAAGHPRDPEPTPVLPPLPVAATGDYGGRHWVADPAADAENDWRRASHTAAVVRRGRHAEGERKWSGNLLEHTQAIDLTAEGLTEAIEGAR
jgi:hypothetical protein